MPKFHPARIDKLVFFALLVYASQLPGQPNKLEVVYPRENLTITPHDSTFVFGNYSPSTAKVYVNGIKARQFPTDTFLAMVPVETGQYTFRTVAKAKLSVGTIDSVAVERRVYIPHYLSTSPRQPLTIDTSYIYPKYDLEMQPGDLLGVVVKGSPGCRVTFSIAGLADNLPLKEGRTRLKRFYRNEKIFGRERPPRLTGVKGVYSGVYRIPLHAELTDASIRIRFVKSNGELAMVNAPGKLSVRPADKLKLARVTQEFTVGRAEKKRSDQLFLPQNVLLAIAGREGDYFLSRLTNDESVWLPIANCEILSASSQRVTASFNSVVTIDRADRADINFSFSARVPFRIRQSKNLRRVEIFLFGVIGESNWVREVSNGSVVDKVYGKQNKNRVFQISIRLKQKQQWGYRSFYNDTSLIVEIKKPPAISDHPLRNLIVCIDPGHAPDLGAVGPTGLSEREATYLLAKALSRKLLSQGARVILTRSREHGITLSARTKWAEVSNADLFISLHYNSLADGINPLKHRGSSVYYFQPQSQNLANSILKELLKKLKLPNFGLFQNNLAVCRITSMPSVLIEPAFIINPVEESFMLDSEFRNATAEAIVKGIEAFVEEAKE